MTYTEQIIQKMIDGGYPEEKVGRISIKPHNTEDKVIAEVMSRIANKEITYPKIFLDPEAWRALGKAMGFKYEVEWMLHRLVDHLFAGGTIESYCKELIENN